METAARRAVPPISRIRHNLLAKLIFKEKRSVALDFSPLNCHN